MTNTYQSKKTKMNRKGYNGYRECQCSYCRSWSKRSFGKSKDIRWILKFDAIPYIK